MESLRRTLHIIVLFTPLCSRRRLLQFLWQILHPPKLVVVTDEEFKKKLKNTKNQEEASVFHSVLMTIPCSCWAVSTAVVWTKKFRQIHPFSVIPVPVDENEEIEEPIVTLSTSSYSIVCKNGVNDCTFIPLPAEYVGNASHVIFKILSIPRGLTEGALKELILCRFCTPKILTAGNTLRISILEQEHVTRNAWEIDGSHLTPELLRSRIELLVYRVTSDGEKKSFLFRVCSSACNFEVNNFNSPGSCKTYVKVSPPPEIPQMNDELCQLLYSFVRAHEISRRKFHLLQPAVLVTGPKRIGKVRGVLRIAGLLDLPVVVKTGTALYGETAGAIENRVDRAFLEANDRFYPNVGILLMTDINRFGYLEGTLNTRAILALKRNLTSSAPGDRSSIITIGTSSTSSAELSSSLIRLFPHEIKLTGLADAEAKLQELLSQSLCPSVASSKTVVDGEIMRNVNNLSVSSLEDLCIRYDVASTQSPDGDAEERFQSCVKSWLQEQGIKAKVSDLSWADVGGLANAKQEILDTIQFPLKHPEFARSGLRRGGALMHGPPGCGKTLLARAVAAQCSLGFISVKGPELINMYVGQSEANVRAVFEKARSVAPCVIFFDEVDSLAPARGRTGDSGGVLDRIVSQFLAELDALNDVSEAEDNGDQSKVVFALAATNRPDLVDPSFLRPGRFDRLVYVGPPETKDQRIQILKAASRSLPLAPDVDFTELESNCPTEATGAVLSSIIKRAAHSAIRRSIQTGLPPEQMKIDMQDFKSVLF